MPVRREPVGDPLEDREFYELCQRYRHTSAAAQADVVAAFADLKAIRDQTIDWIRQRYQQDGARPEFVDWLKGQTMAQLTAGVICALVEIQRRGFEPEVLWSGEQWAIATRDSG